MAEFRKVALEDIPAAPVHMEIDFSLRAPRERVWELLADPTTWADWCPGFSAGSWETRTPEGVGSVRAVRVGGLPFRESILAHDPGKRWAFRVDSTPAPAARALAEDYRLADAPDGCVLHWSAGIWPHGPAWLARPLIVPAFRTFAGMLGRGLERAAARSAA